MQKELETSPKVKLVLMIDTLLGGIRSSNHGMLITWNYVVYGAL